ncbi:hypothetical protein BN2475_340010 [Paraburkholderia ribeironis]|uniref:Uncharacterized protein n=1 Tax=Paraburkholderia ribeironis TaxID=1247936 RepID=A0A1N7S3M4_9BURK|nr:hypothetical protein BN2475_340010 [Paraburkholderia ribeironis]
MCKSSGPHSPPRGDALLTGLLQPSVKRLASTRNKLLKTMAIGLSGALPYFASVPTVRHSARPPCDPGHMTGPSA